MKIELIPYQFITLTNKNTSSIQAPVSWEPPNQTAIKVQGYNSCVLKVRVRGSRSLSSDDAALYVMLRSSIDNSSFADVAASALAFEMPMGLSIFKKEDQIVEVPLVGVNYLKPRISTESAIAAFPPSFQGTFSVYAELYLK